MRKLWAVPARIFLSPLVWLFRAGTIVRTIGYSKGLVKTRRLPVPVVSIGNIAVGGAGKTPATILVAGMLLKEGWKPAVVSRGYGRHGRGVLVVSDGVRVLAKPREAGDEPYLTALSLPGVAVVVGADRYSACVRAIRECGCDSVVLDDGFQHLKLGRDVDIVAVDATAPFGPLLPAGRFREPATALRRANLIILTRVDQCGDGALLSLRSALAKVCPGIPIVESRHAPTGIVGADDGSQLAEDDGSAPLCGMGVGRQRAGSGMQTAGFGCAGAEVNGPWLLAGASREGSICRPRFAELEGKKVFAVSGIGRPLAFERTVADAGARIVGGLRYPDHHWFTGADIRRIAELAQSAGAQTIVTTEKDFVRLPSHPPVPVQVVALRIAMEIVEGGRWLTACLEGLCRSRQTT